MIYLDNAATTRVKPEVVYDGFMFFLKNNGVSPGRGSYKIGIEASRMLYKTRCLVGEYFGLNEKENTIFTKNSTEAINLFLDGFLKKGDHVIISCYEHNAVLRPLQNLKNRGIIDYSIISRKDLDTSVAEIYQKYVKKSTKLLALTLASNLTGRIIFNEKLVKYFSEKGICTFVDSSQGAGQIQISMENQKIDYLAFTGHKDLMAVPGVGGLCSRKKLTFSPLIQGGTGIHGEEYTNPNVYPEGYEAGTLNMPAIWSLHEGINYINENKKSITKTKAYLTEYLLNKLSTISNIIVYDYDKSRVSTVAFNISGISSASVVQTLDQNGICVRGGIHCAILAHEALGTVKTGAVRVSLGYFNSRQDIDSLIYVLERMTE